MKLHKERGHPLLCSKSYAPNKKQHRVLSAATIARLFSVHILLGFTCFFLQRLKSPATPHAYTISSEFYAADFDNECGRWIGQAIYS